MAETHNLGRRIELVPMDPHFHDITVALYRQQRSEGTSFVVHTYSHIHTVSRRIASIVEAMRVLGGMELTPHGLLRFPCGRNHELACKRIFLEACKLELNHAIKPRPLNILDKKSGLNFTILNVGNGAYQVSAQGEARNKQRRISAIAGGLIKLGQMVDESTDLVSFACEHSHDAMVGLLLIRAPNVRAIMREQEMTAARGVLSAPSQQE